MHSTINGPDVNDKSPLTPEDFDRLIESAYDRHDYAEVERLLDRQHADRHPAPPVAGQRIDEAAGEREVTEYDPPAESADPPENAGQLAWPFFDAERRSARVDGLAAAYPDPQDCPAWLLAIREGRDRTPEEVLAVAAWVWPAFAVGLLITETDAAFVADAAVIDAEFSSCGWSPTEARHRGRLYGLRQLLDEIEANVDDTKEAPQATENEPVAVKKPSDHRMPAHLLSPGGFLGRLIGWILSQSFKPQAELALGAALSILSLLTGRKIMSTQGTRTNLYIVAVAPSGAGKESPRACIKRLLVASGLGGSISEGAVSGQGLLSAVRAVLSHLTVWDEFGLVLQAIGDKNAGPHLKSIISNLLRLFSSSNSVFAGEARADMKHESAEAIVEPHEVLYGSTTPETFYPALDENAVTSGFLGRFLFFIAEGEYVQPNMDLRDCPPPAEVLEESQWWATYSPGTGDLKPLSPQPRTVSLSDEADTLYREWYLRRDREAHAVGGWRQTLLVRAGELASKLVLLHAVSLDRESRHAGIASVTWATEITDFLLNRLADIADRKISSNPYERIMNELVEFIASRGAVGATSSELARVFRKIKVAERRAALEHAREAGRIVEEIRQSNGGRSAIVYLAT